MPKHLEQINIEAIGILNTVPLWLDTVKETGYTPSSVEPKLDKCIAKELEKNITPLLYRAAAKLYTTASRAYLSPCTVD